MKPIDILANLYFLFCFIYSIYAINMIRRIEQKRKRQKMIDDLITSPENQHPC
jgi:hypothetical protein